MHNYRYFKENVDKKEKIDFFKIGRLKESLPFASVKFSIDFFSRIAYNINEQGCLI